MADDLCDSSLLEQWMEIDSDVETESEVSDDDKNEGLVEANGEDRAIPSPKVENTLSFKLGEDYNSPVYIQRYQTVAEILSEPIPGTDTKIKRVVDFGCAELNFFKYLKNLPNLSEMSFVDIDASLLQSHCVKTRPLAFDYLHRRKKALTVRVFAGSVAVEDQRVQGVDAVTCIELIEHLNEDVLCRLPSVVFGHIRPKLVAITTPNVEFNVLFPNSTGFRHWDHKFEWTRLQFRKWCLSIVDKYSDYVFTVSGIGEGPPGSEHLGCCSQLAVFTIRNPHNKPMPELNCTPYELIAEHVYPSERKKRISPAEQILLTAEYYIHMLGKYMLDNEADGNTVQLPLKKILEFPQMTQHSCDESQLAKLLAEKGWDISENCGSFSLLYILQEEEESEEECDRGDGDTELSFLTQDIRCISLDKANESGDSLEDWDAM